MKLEEIREIALQHGIKPGKSKKADLIRAIQAAEANEQCFEAGKSDHCGQNSCLWKPLCC